MPESNFNQAAWDRIAADEDKWFRAVTSEQIEAARAGNWSIKITPTRDVPSTWFGEVRGKKILCLAGGGGQQAPILAAAGALVTVVDFSQQQLQRDAKAAEKYKLSIITVQADMTNLSSLPAVSFDLILNPTSVCYVPVVPPIWQQCHRVLCSGGRLIAGFMLPVNFIFDPIERDRRKLKVSNAIPYSDLELPDQIRSRLLSPVRPAEFGHSLEDLIGEQTAVGFQLRDFYTDRWGDADIVSEHIDVFGATLATKA